MMQDVDELVPHMRRVQGAQRDLRDLGVVWQMIESSAAISCPEEADTILPTLISTRERFDDLQLRLVQQMANENCAALGDQLGAKAQCAIDILVRNLFERTADVGFLATDDVVRDFCGAAEAQQQAQQAAMLQRLREYQAKYSVYDDVILLSTSGRILARLDSARELRGSTDGIVAEALAASGYVERFRTTDLSANEAPALLYGHRIDDGHGRALGVLVLRFRFTDEMHYVFASMADERHEMALVLLDESQRVIVSNDEAHVPVGARLTPVPVGEVALTSFAGREYLAVSRASAGYQGYGGPPWRAQAMISLLTGFRQSNVPPSPDDRDVPLDNDALHTINDNADEINRDLRRVVWNGQLMAGAQQVVSRRLKAMLDQVNQAGRRTRERVSIAIKDLHGTSLARARGQVADLARLAADIMDRNLYERANDCRWWALSPALRRLLAAPADAANGRALNGLLDHINSLYTVYSRLVVFDGQGCIRGASHADDSGLVGTTIDSRWPEAARGLRDTQHYHVSPFEDSPLHQQGETYVYLAAVHGDDAGRAGLGGIAIVFNAARELKAMLSDVLGDRQGVAAFVDAGGKVLAATDPGLAAGIVRGLAGDAAVVAHGGAHYACARVNASGYREFKTSDGYDNQVRAIVALRLGASDRRRTAYSELPLQATPPRRSDEALQLAVFQVGAMRCALPTAVVVEAVSPDGLVRVPPGMAPTIGLLEVLVDGTRCLVPVLCAREHFALTYPARVTDGVVLVLRLPHGAHPLVGLRVDDVLSVLDVDRSRLHDAPSGFSSFAPWLGGMLEVSAAAGDHQESVLVQLLDVTKFSPAGDLAAWPAEFTADAAEPVGPELVAAD